MTVLADTGGVYALIDASDKWHAPVRDWWSTRGREVLVPVVVLPEITYLLHTRIGITAEQAFVRAIASGEFALEPLEHDDIVRAAELLEDYADLPLGFVDAALVAMAERLGTRELLTTDRRHFGVLTPRHARNFELRP